MARHQRNGAKRLRDRFPKLFPAPATADAAPTEPLPVIGCCPPCEFARLLDSTDLDAELDALLRGTR